MQHDKSRIIGRLPEGDSRTAELKAGRKSASGMRGRWMPCSRAHPASAADGLNSRRVETSSYGLVFKSSLEPYQQVNARLHRQGLIDARYGPPLDCIRGMDEDVAAALQNKQVEAGDLLLAALKAG